MSAQSTEPEPIAPAIDTTDFDGMAALVDDFAAPQTAATAARRKRIAEALARVAAEKGAELARAQDDVEAMRRACEAARDLVERMREAFPDDRAAVETRAADALTAAGFAPRTR